MIVMNPYKKRRLVVLRRCGSTELHNQSIAAAAAATAAISDPAEDRLSGLPDEIVVHILSKLGSTTQAYRTCLCSKRYSDLWLYPYDLGFDSRDMKKLDQFDRFVDYVLSQSRRKDIYTKSFTYHREGAVEQHTLDTLSGFLNSFGCRTSIEYLDLYFGYSTLYVASLNYFTLNNMDSLKGLKLTVRRGCVGLRSTPPPPSLFRNLERVFLQGCLFEANCSFKTMFSNCPKLFDLTLLGWVGDIIISAPQLSRIKLDMRFEVASARISSPNLTSLDLASRQGPSFTVNVDLPLLRSVCLNLAYSDSPPSTRLWTPEFGKNINDMLKRFRRAQVLTVTTTTLQAFTSFPGSLLNQSSPFGELESLKIIKSKKKVSVDIPGHVLGYLMNSSPYVKIVLELLDEE